MDLIYTDKNKTDIGILKDYNFDLAYGSSENNFELTVPIDNNVLFDDYYIYAEGTEYGGKVDSIEVDTKEGYIKCKGRTFQGIIEKKVITPNAGQDYYTVTGDINTILGGLITRLGLEDLYKASTATTKNITYQFSRYTDAYKGINKMLRDNGYKLKMEYINGYVWLSAVPVVIYNEDTGLDSDRISINIQKTYNIVNHLICLGAGNLSNRTVIDLYLDEDGNISNTKVFTGIEEITDVFDYPNAESATELREKGIERLLGQNTNNIEITLGEGYEFSIGDIITVSEVLTGITVTRRINKKIVTINKDILKINYLVGE